MFYYFFTLTILTFLEFDCQLVKKLYILKLFSNRVPIKSLNALFDKIEIITLHIFQNVGHLPYPMSNPTS